MVWVEFLISAAVITIASMQLAKYGDVIGLRTKLGGAFAGTLLLASATSLPELITTISAVRSGIPQLAAGNLFGSNMFNMFAIGLTDVFYTRGRFLAAIDPSFLLIGMLGLLMTGMGLIGNLAKLERRVWFIEMDALALILLYFGGLFLLYFRG